MLPTLSLKALTWIRDNHGLFDYETLELNKNTLELRESCRLVRCGHSVGTEGEVDVSTGDRVEPLASLQLLDGTVSTNVGHFLVSDCSRKPEFDGQLDKLWLIINSNSSNQFRRILHDLNNDKEIIIEQGTVFKLGRIPLRVKNLRLDSSESLCGTLQEEGVSSEGARLTARHGSAECSSDNAEPCRICYMSANSKDDPLLSICSCTGSMKSVHYRCLKVWLETKVTKKQLGNVTSYYVTTLECEICKTRYPGTFAQP